MMKNNKKYNNIRLIIFSIIGLIFFILYYFDPFERNKQVQLFETLLIFGLATIITFVPKWKKFSNYTLMGFIIIIVVRYFL